MSSSPRRAPGLALRGLASAVCSLPWAATLAIVPSTIRATIATSFAPLCHHWAGRVLTIAATGPMCVCSRCAGLYGGLALGFVVGASAERRADLRIGFGVAAVMLLADVMTQDLGLHAPWHASRLVTGAALGFVTAAWMVAETTGRASARRSDGVVAPYDAHAMKAA